MDPFYSLLHTTTPQNTHTQALTTKTAAGDEEGTPAGEGEADGDEGRRQTECFGQFSGDPRTKIGKLRLESKIAGFGQFAGNNGRSDADEGTLGSVEEVETTLNEKGENLAYDSYSFRAPPKLGFSEASPFINGGRKFETFNLDEFLRLANVVIDKGDKQTITALSDLKIRWKERFRSVPSLRSLVDRRDAPPRVGGLRPAMRCLLPSGTSSGGSETAGNSTDSDLQSPVPEISRLSTGNELALLPPSTDMPAPVKGDRRLTSPATVGIPKPADVASVGDVEGKVEGTVAVDKDGDVTGNITAEITPNDITTDIMDDVILRKKTKK
ncbi:UNVERIFIED_CONTAM: hypothetical protein Sindi_1201600 [Sesamum indicum]